MSKLITEQESRKNANRITRLSFMKSAVVLAGAFFSHNVFMRPLRGAIASLKKTKKGGASNPPMKLIYIAIDGFHPNYLALDAKGNNGGKEGNWLMPNLNGHLKKMVLYTNAKAYLPAATDMNHLNALAGTSTAQNGIIGVWAQPTGWDKNGDPVIKHSHLSFARDEKGRQVDTLFHAWKRAWPGSKTLFISGKEWVVDMFRTPGTPSVIDLLVSGYRHPSYLNKPEKESFADPFSDTDAACDPESGSEGFFDFKHLTWNNFRRHFSSSAIMTRLYNGQYSLLTRQMEYYPERFPHDSWIVDSTLALFKREDPDMAYVLLAQCDDAGHCIGSAWDPSEFVDDDKKLAVGDGCTDQDAYRKVSSRNKLLYREAILDVIRDVDLQFGRLMDGLKKQGNLDNAMLILLSDHGSINHVATSDFSSTDIMGILKESGAGDDRNVYAFSVSSYGVLYWRDDKKKVALAKQILLKHTTLNSQNGKVECPWWVLDRDDMKNGVPGVALPGELYHTYYVDIDKEKNMIWPDLIILCKNGWQIPVYNGHVPNVGIAAPKWTPPFRVYNGGHGSVDTLPILAAISVPRGKAGVSARDVRIGDLAVTAASVFGLTLQSTTIGKDLSRDVR
jgi:predicted AlkP superfamily pyrophosphatase or phosphodiesterase